PAGGEVVRAAERAPLEIVAPVVDWSPAGAPPLVPILFITVACGAISGFHCLVGSGTTSKRIAKETDARAIGYGSMLTEGFLAVLVIVACAAGLGLGVTKGVGWMARGSGMTEAREWVHYGTGVQPIPRADGSRDWALTFQYWTGEDPLTSPW